LFVHPNDVPIAGEDTEKEAEGLANAQTSITVNVSSHSVIGRFLVTATTGRVADTGHLEKDIAVQPGHLTISETIRFCGRLSAPYFR